MKKYLIDITVTSILQKHKFHMIFSRVYFFIAQQWKFLHWFDCQHPGPAFIKPDQLDPRIKDQLGKALLSAILILQ